MKRSTKIIILVISIITFIMVAFLAAIFILYLYMAKNASKMPFNGYVEFHDIAVTVPEEFVRDSTQSNEDFYIFEQGGYKKYILISRTDADGINLEGYVAAMEGVGAECEYVGNDIVEAAISRVTNDRGEYCQEICFFYKDSRYAVAMRGAGYEEFLNFTDTIEFHGDDAESE